MKKTILLVTMLFLFVGVCSAGSVAERKQFAHDYEIQMLERGMDMVARAKGKDQTTLEIKWILVNRVRVYHLINNEPTMALMKRLGFVLLVMTDGHGKTWRYDLIKEKFRQ